MAGFALTVASGQSVSSAFALTQYAGALLVAVPSHGAGWGAVRVEFSVTSGGGTFAPFLDPRRAEVPLAVWSGAGPGFGALLTPPTAYGRIALTGSAAITTSFSVLPLLK